MDTSIRNGSVWVYRHNIEELCDILEVVYAIAVAKGHSVSEINALRTNKNTKNGAFKKKLFLEKVVDKID